MKKTIIFSLSMFLFGAVAVNAQNAAPATHATEAVAKVAEKTPVKKEELPEAVKTTLASDDYKGWEVAEAFLVADEKSAHYEINMKQGDKTTLVKLNKDGKKVD